MQFPKGEVMKIWLSWMLSGWKKNLGEEEKNRKEGRKGVMSPRKREKEK